MTIKISVPYKFFTRFASWVKGLSWQYLILTPAIATAVIATAISYSSDALVAYGDAESHLNIAKRVVSSLTPGAAQLGGIWLPVPHIMMVPFVWSDFLWRSGIAGAIVSGFCFVVSCLVLYKVTMLLTKNRFASLIATYVFMLNPNILYLQSTAMTELPLILFFLLSSYYFAKYIKNPHAISSLIGAAFFGFIAAMTRYDGWFLVALEAGLIVLLGILRKTSYRIVEGKVVLFSTLAFLGIFLWLLWGQLILGNAFYFTQSQFSAKTQQQAWLAKGELPAYHDFPLAFSYYFVTSMSNSGMVLFFIGIAGMIWYLLHREHWRERASTLFLLLAPFLFNVATLFMGQSVIFIPHLTPVGFEWRLFNVRYGVMMVPVIAVFVGYMLSRVKLNGKLMILSLCLVQIALFGIGYSKVITYADGTEGLSHAKRPDAEIWMKEHYNGGLVLVDDYARTMSVIRSGIPMQDIIYIGTKPYWDESFVTPEKYATWIVMQKSDAIWNALYEKPDLQSRLYTYFEKAYTSPDILIFHKRAQ